jgi:hypothetical protein
VSVSHELGLTPASVYYVAEGRRDVAGWVRREVKCRFEHLGFDPFDAVNERAGIQAGVANGNASMQ